MAAALPASLPSLPRNTPTVQLDDYGIGRGTADISHGEFDRYRIVAPVTGGYTIRVDPVSGSRLNPVVGVYDAAGRKLTGNDDVPEGVASEVRVALRQGKTYSFAVGTIERTMGSYAWVVDGPRTEDEYETGSANPFAAYDLGLLGGSVTIPHLILRDSQDWFRFTTSAAGTVGDAVTISSDRTNAPLRLSLYGSASGFAEPLATSTAGGNATTVSLQGLPAGEYYAQISGAKNPSYSLDVRPGSGDVPQFFVTNFRDAAVRDALQTAFASAGAIGRADMLSVFRQVARDGQVTANELIDLQTTIRHFSYLKIPEPVRVLAAKVILGDPANRLYRGQPLGNLSAGAPAAHLEALTAKHFLGSDLPAAYAVGRNKQRRDEYAYQTVAGSLFSSGGTPRYSDVRQGSLSDCYLLAGMAVMALRRPQNVVDAFIANDDETFTVRFFPDANGNADYVTVSRNLPVDSLSRLVFASTGRHATDSSQPMWVALWEKGFVQANESGRYGRTSTDNDYRAIELGWSLQAIRHLSALQGQWAETTFAAASRAFVDDKLVVPSTPTSFGNDDAGEAITTNRFGLHAGHVYVVIDRRVERVTPPRGRPRNVEKLLIFNPWGTTADPPRWLSPTQYNASFTNNLAIA